MNRLIFCFITIAFFTACGGGQKEEKKPEPKEPGNIVSLTADQYKNADIRTDTLSHKMVSAILRVNGKIDVPPQNTVSVSAPLGGYLQSMKLLPGMHITKGQTLAVMEDNQYIQLQQDYLTARARLSYAEQEYNRQKELNASKA
ncbi:MAG: efflux transporter periplasmic adaptor subunit, partial [Bacteroidetes bacterium]|nr:efflux transporter periplasmic adaptor subunit [Bacteroidota bacterium]